MKHKERLDVLLVEKGLCESRSRAQAVIMSGEVYVNGQKSDKPGTPTDVEAEIEVRGNACPYVSRGGLKLEKALRDFGVSPAGLTCLDSGASTGGFTDCLLQNGAKRSLRLMLATASSRGASAPTRVSCAWNAQTFVMLHRNSSESRCSSR